MWSYPRRKATRLRPAAQFNNISSFNLPEEVLSKVFKHLSANDRKSVRLVCKSWFDACHSPALLNDEVLNFPGVYTVSDINQVLVESQRRFLNLKFDNVIFDGDSSFWKNNGSRIRSIVFKNCLYFNLEKVIIFCPNLLHLSITCEHDFYDLLDPIVEDLARASRTGIVRENLNFLEIQIPSSFYRFGDIALNHLFSIFPKAKILKILLYNRVGENLRCFISSRVADYVYTFAPVLNYLIASTDRIEKLNLYVRFCWTESTSNTFHRLLETLAAMKKLTELSIDLGPLSVLQQEDVENFLYSKPLKSLTYYSCERKSSLESLESLFFQLLSSNSSLKQINIGASNVRVEATRVEANPIEAESEPLFQKGLKPFLQRFQNLIHHLHLTDVSCMDLQLVLKYQKKLKSLIIEEEKHVYYPSDLERKLLEFREAFHQLKDIEHLELTHSVSHIFFRSLTPQSVLVNMKYLKINLHDHDWLHALQTIPPHLLRLADALPFLEGLWIDLGQDIPFYICWRLCAKLSRLRYFRSIDKILFRKELSLYEKHDEFRKLFSICPSLRVLFCHDWVYYFNVINKQIGSSRKGEYYHHFPQFLAEPKIGGHVIDWLQFYS